MMYRMIIAAALLVTTAVANPVMAIETAQGSRPPLAHNPNPPPRPTVRNPSARVNGTNVRGVARRSALERRGRGR